MVHPVQNNSIALILIVQFVYRMDRNYHNAYEGGSNSIRLNQILSRFNQEATKNYSTSDKTIFQSAISIAPIYSTVNHPAWQFNKYVYN